MAYTQEQIQEKYERLPAEIRAAMDSVDTTNALVDIGESHDLMYDQISELVDETGLVLLGITPSAMFTGNISRRMKVDAAKAAAIARDVNAKVFDKMRASLQKIQDQSDAAAVGEETLATDLERKVQQRSVVSAVEAAGGFIIDKPAEPAPSKTSDQGVSKEETLKGIEDPDRLLESSSSIVDTLLAHGVAIPADTGASKPLPSAQPSKIKPGDGIDPYREPIR